MRVDVRVRALALALLVGVLIPVPAPAQPAARSITLQEAVARALEKNEGILVERDGVAAARASEKGSRGIYDPVVRLETGWRRSVEPVNSTFSGAPLGRNAPTTRALDVFASVQQYVPSGGTLSLRAIGARETTDGIFALLSPSYASRIGFEFRQPLLVVLPDAHRAASYPIRVAAADRDRAEATLHRQVVETVAAVERAYWTLDAARREIDVRDEAVQLAEEQLGQTRTRVEQGVAAETEVAQPRAELERRRGELFASREALSRAENALKVLILGDDDTDLWVPPLAPAEEPEIGPVTVDVAAWMEKALASRPEIRMAQAVLERRHQERMLARERARPTLDAVAAYDRFGLSGRGNPLVSAPGGGPVEIGDFQGGWGHSFSSIGSGGFNDARIGVVFQMPIGNRAARGASAAAQAFERQAQTELAQTRKVIRAEVLDAAAALQTAEQRIAAARAAREAAEVQLSAERERYAVGLSTNFLVLTRQNDLARARLDEIASVHDYRTARTGVARATGTLLDERQITVEGL